jgi:hypothetical protein
MSLLKRLGIHSAVLSFVEIVLFFLVITGLYFGLLSSLYAVVAGSAAKVSASMVFVPLMPSNLGDWAGILPAWMWILEGLGYLLLITIYWSPGEAEVDESELRGFVIFVVTALVALAVWLQAHGWLSQLAGVFWNIVTTSGGRK